MTKVELLRKMLNWCKEFNRDHFKDTPSFITAIMPLVNQEPDKDWEKRVKTAMIEWACNATIITRPVDVDEDPDLALYSMFHSAVVDIHEGNWDKAAEFFGD